MGLRKPRAADEPGRRWRLVFNMDDPQTMRVISVSKREGGVSDAVTLFRAAVREAMEANGCRNVVIGVHVEGAECDHEVGG